MRIAVDGVVDVRFDTLALQTVTELVGSLLAVVVGDDHRAHHELAVHELVAQAQHVLVVGDAQVGAHLVLLNVVGADHDDNLNRVAQLAQHAELRVGLETRQHARGVVVVKQLAAQLHIQLTVELRNAFANVFRLNLQVLLVVESYFHLFFFNLVFGGRRYKKKLEVPNFPS